MKKNLPFVALLLLIAVCKENDVRPVVVSTDFMPLSEGNYWIYERYRERIGEIPEFKALDTVWVESTFQEYGYSCTELTFSNNILKAIIGESICTDMEDNIYVGLSSRPYLTLIDGDTLLYSEDETYDSYTLMTMTTENIEIPDVSVAIAGLELIQRVTEYAERDSIPSGKHPVLTKQTYASGIGYLDGFLVYANSLTKIKFKLKEYHLE